MAVRAEVKKDVGDLWHILFREESRGKFKGKKKKKKKAAA